MKLFIKLFLVGAQLLSCEMSVNHNMFENSEWRFYYDDKDFGFIYFEDDLKYIEFDSEIREHYYGTYEVKRDTIILHQERGEYDHEFPNSHHVAGKAVYKLILKNNNQLGYLQNWDSEKKKWKEDFYYTKVENSKK